MKLYNIDPQNVYPDAKVRIVPGHQDRAVIVCTNHMSVDEWYPLETEGFRIDGHILFWPCMGWDPEKFDPASPETRLWVEEWSYPLTMAEAMVKQLNFDSRIEAERKQ